MPKRDRKNGRTSFDKVQTNQKITRKDALKIRACYEELPNMPGLQTTLAEMYNVTPTTIRRIWRNELHSD